MGTLRQKPPYLAPSPAGARPKAADAAGTFTDQGVAHFSVLGCVVS
jgi:hypothetical protein